MVVEVAAEVELAQHSTSEIEGSSTAHSVKQEQTRASTSPASSNIYEKYIAVKPSLGRKVTYVHCDALCRAADLLPVHAPNRHQMSHALIDSCNLLQSPVVGEQLTSCESRAHIIVPRPATIDQVCEYHDEEYVSLLCNLGKATAEVASRPQKRRRGSSMANTRKMIRCQYSSQELLEEFGLGEDCPVFPHVEKHALWICGASLAAANELISKKADIAINWTGGRHHAQRSKAAGFCYFNDVVLSILRLQESFTRVLFIDIDVHHGDGVESAFHSSESVFTLSFHLYEPGFYPGTGNSAECGSGPGTETTRNVPLNRGTIGSSFRKQFELVVSNVFQSFNPEAVVLLCGADCLAGDPRGGLKLNCEDVAWCCSFVGAKCDVNNRISCIPLLVLGGGGYDFVQTSKCWATCTAALLGGLESLPAHVPEHQYWELYGPSWELRP